MKLVRLSSRLARARTFSWYVGLLFTLMGAVCLTPAQISDFAAEDTNRIQGVIAKCLAANSPFVNVLDGGVFASGQSDEVRSVVQMPAAPGDSLAKPTFVNDTEVCGTNGLEDKVGTVEYSYRLQTKRGRGPRVCVKQGYSAFRDAYTRAEDSLSKLITQYINSDVKYQTFVQSASKFVCATGWNFESLFTGGSENDIYQRLVPLTPNAPLTFKALHRVARHLREVTFAEPFGSGAQAYARFIGGAEIVESFRRETGVQEVLTSLTQGSYDMGKTSLTSYSWDVAPAYRGIGFAIDQRPLRYNAVDGNGWPILIDPVTTVVDPVKNKAYSKASPTWLSAQFELGALYFKNSFERLVPERFVGEGSFRFAPQLVMGELEWHYVKDNDCNTWGDYGWHKYQIVRAYKPVRPQHVCWIAFKRCEADMGLATCTVTGDTYTGAETTGGVL